jgi:4-hydroxyphenylpyruvate dioxygenase
MDYLSWSRHYRSFPGQGELPVDAFMEALHATGYDGLLSHENFSDRFRAGSARSLALDGQRSFIFMLDELRRRTGAPVPGLSELPPRVTCTGVEFVEFAMDDAAAADFEKLLSGLGFVRVGRHKSKEVDRWRQGDVNIVVNREKEGFAHSFYVTHGSSVCAIALKVDDASAAVERAVRLLDQPFRQGVGSGELEIPAVRGLGGSLVYFVDEKSAPSGIWDVDFDPVPPAPGAAEAGIRDFDHISQSMHDQEMLTWLLFYTSLLDVRKTRVQDVLDPGGIVHSQVVATEDGSLRLVLNASQSQRTLASRFLNALFGSGVQHIALATDDIFATVERLRANGVDLLPIPVNYYDDLEARTDLSAEDIERLRESRILYDREGSAEYFQVYTRTLENGFFFEIVERRNYAGFGAANASIRLAAQTMLAPHPTMPRI